jgi:uncharacterized protein involved in exopolysaccharide biosynthesis
MTQIVPTLMKYRLFIASCTAVCLLASLATVLLLSPRYEVTAKLLFKLGRELAPPTGLTNPGAVAIGKRPEDITSEVEIMHNQFLIEKLVADLGTDLLGRETEPKTFAQKMKAVVRWPVRKVQDGIREVFIYAGLEKRLTPTEQAVMSLQREVSVEEVRRSDVVVVRMRTRDPDIGVAILSKFLDLYLEQHILAYTETRGRQFFERQVREIRTQLAASEQARADFKRAKSLGDLAEQRRALLAQEREMTATHATTLADLARLEREVASLTQAMTVVPREVRLSSTVQRNPLIGSLRERLTLLEAKQDSLRGRYSDDNRVMLEVAREIEGLRETLNREEIFLTQSVTSGLNNTLQEIEKELHSKRAALDGFRARATEQADSLAKVVTALRELEEVDLKYRRLERETAVLEQNYLLYSKQLEEARISEAMDQARISNVSLIAPPTASPIPVWPPKGRLLLGGVVLGFVGSFFLAFLIEFLYPTIRSRDDVQRILGAPVLAAIPEVTRKWFHAIH